MGIGRIFQKVRKFGHKIGDSIVPKRLARFQQSTRRGMARNKIVKAVVIAAAIYFTAGAALGAAGAAGGSMWSGALAGMGSAGTGLTTGAFLGGASAAGAGTVAGGATAGLMGTLTPAAINAGGGSAIAAGEAAGTVLGTSASPLAAAGPMAGGQAVGYGVTPTAQPSGGIMNNALEFMKTPGGGMATSAALQLAGGAMGDKAEANAAAEELARRNANQNVGSLQFNPLGAQPLAQRLGPVPVPGFDPYQQLAPGLVNRRVAGA
jgi:hypothetical protein